MKFVSKVRETYHTLRHVKPVQVAYRIKYALKRTSSLKKIGIENKPFSPLLMLPFPSVKKFVQRTETGVRVRFLNLSETYREGIDWADMKYGKLWNYHLQYGDFLKQTDLSVDFRKKLILDLYQWLEEGKLRPEPYPASLRIMNGIRFLSRHQNELESESESELIEYVYSELHFLENHLEYHLLGNHLLENAFALLMGGTFFQKKEWIRTAESIFNEQISEQVLEDGGHFERTPMYHLILLFRFLEALYYLPDDSQLSSPFYTASQKMLGWIDQMSFSNGELAHFNDSTDQQTCTKSEIFELAEKCGIADIPPVELAESGYRKFTNKNFELLIDTTGIEPSYQPGHAHADSLSFILHVQGQAMFIDPGVSTYEAGERRNWERSTKAHNTVTCNGANTAGVWKQFRVGRRPQVTIRNQTPSEIQIHLKYALKSGETFEHERNIAVSDEFIEINEKVNLETPVEGRLFLQPAVRLNSFTPQMVEFTNGVIVYFSDAQHIRQFTYDYCKSFNIREKSKAIEYSFIKHSSLKIVAPKI